MDLVYRNAIPEDAGKCIKLRGETRENTYSVEELAEVGITLDTWRDGIENGSFPGYVCVQNDVIVGMCFADKESGEILVVSILPDFEGYGIGRKLLRLTLDELKRFGHRNSFLGCNSSPISRSYGFYRHLGWIPTGAVDGNGDEVLEIHL